MNLTLTAQEIRFRDEVRTFLREALPPDLSDKVNAGRRLEREDYMRWHRILAAKGWVAPSWPIERGGTDWSAMQKHLFEEACWEAGAPQVQPPGIKLAAPVIMRYGSAWQQDHFLPRIYNGTDFWCQGYSEPGAGSDLAALQTRARLDGDHYVIDGQKTWITLAQWADMMFCLVRTSSTGKRQEGITFLLIDMKTPGITVRPIETLDHDHEVNEVFFDNVRVPVVNRVGEEGKGWTYAKVLLGHERTAIASVSRSKRDLRLLKRLAHQEQQRGRPLAEDAVFARKLARVEMALMALEVTVLRVIAAEARQQGPGPEASLLKIKGTEIRQQITALMLEAAGPQALPLSLGWLNSEPGAPACVDPAIAPIAATHFNTRKTSIFGGTNEVQRNIIAKTILGM
jgi:alkylation response protein AidB-like acyl-CoA dehydrogenase